MSDLQKREELKKVYPNSDSWRAKVDKMSPAQVNAIYAKFAAEQKLRR